MIDCKMFEFKAVVEVQIKYVACRNSSNAYLNPICHLLTLLGAHHILHVNRIKVNPLTPNDPYRGRTAPLTSKVAFYIFIQQT
jgi:hypothetical protein